MNPKVSLLLAAATVALAIAVGFGLGRVTTSRKPVPETAAPETARRPLYWYDPMYPAQHFDRPGKSPFMNMQLQPRYAGEEAAGAGVRIDPAKAQNIGVRTVAAERGTLPSRFTATGLIGFDEREVAVVQPKAAGFVQRVYGRAPNDIVRAGAPLADLLIPEWAGAQTEFLAVLKTGDVALTRAARERLQLLGMTPALVDAVESSGQVRNVVTVATPLGGVIKTLGVRAGMSVAAGQTLAEVNGLGRVWLNAYVPEAATTEVRVGDTASATLSAFPGQTFAGRVTAVLPEAQAESRTATARIELPNSRGQLRPGMFATVQFQGASRPALLVPTEAVIRTGKRALVMLAEPDGRYLPAEIQTGREADGCTEVLAGLSDGEKVVASGQFLIDSEASLSGVQARPASAAHPAPAPAQPTLYETTGRVEQITPTSVTLSHQPVPTLNWPAMTMQFRLTDPSLAKGVKVGDRVAFGFHQPAAGPTVRRLTKAGQ